MALEEERINFLLAHIVQSKWSTFRSTCKQLFTYFENETQQNVVYEKYEKEIEKWIKYFQDKKETDKNLFKINNNLVRFEIPNDFEDSKSLAYYIYKSIATQELEWINNFLIHTFYHEFSQSAIEMLNSIFLGYFKLVIKEIVECEKTKKTN